MPRWTKTELDSYLKRINQTAAVGAFGVVKGPPTANPLADCRAVIAPTTDEAKLNKTERAYLAFLRSEQHWWIGVQNVTLKLADDTRFTVDNVVINPEGRVEGHEVKGFMRGDALVKLKVAARQFPWITFWLVRKTKNGWNRQPVKP